MHSCQRYVIGPPTVQWMVWLAKKPNNDKGLRNKVLGGGFSEQVSMSKIEELWKLIVVCILPAHCRPRADTVIIMSLPASAVSLQRPVCPGHNLML